MGHPSPGMVLMRLLISFAALFLSVILMQLGSGGVVPLDALSGVALGFSPGEIGLIGSAHFFGFLIGCWWAPRLMGSVGHSRAFAAFTAAGAIGIMAHMMLPDPRAWGIFRMATGLSAAGCYTIIEAWLQSKATNANRGRAMGVYRIIDIGGSLGAQMMIGFLEPASYFSYNLLALLACAALFPLVLTKVEAPQSRLAPRLRPTLAWEKSPLAAVGVFISGITGGAFRMVGPLYGVAVGLDAKGIAAFLSVYVIGGALAQFPTGWMADKFDRRKVLAWLAFGSIMACLFAIAAPGLGPWAIYLAAGAFGLTTMPLYSIASAHANDFSEDDERVELSAALLFLYAIGAIASPVAASSLIGAFGPAGMFGMIALAHLALLLFGLHRMRVRPSPTERSGWAWVTKTSFLTGRLLHRRPPPPPLRKDPD